MEQGNVIDQFYIVCQGKKIKCLCEAIESDITYHIGKQEAKLALRVNSAAYHGDLYQLKSLIQTEADPKKTDYDGRSPLTRNATGLVALAIAMGLGAFTHTLGTLVPVIRASGFATVAAATTIGTVVGVTEINVMNTGDGSNNDSVMEMLNQMAIQLQQQNNWTFLQACQYV
ncbi:uncharacterized protein LOC114318042 isoform X1 [Camellia sinensis]|uniref:uncharacterized protein LOC114318042 isoform X1 n=1 Tax=Camellia sinensis TaxID=4442 RepID=UPI00103628E6|nr:uncharacterized protein LOC114318042 isoform X1 [Camellia sinensis]XP_028120685.1 uncharacterized protein LOC114318042 isoform X1 [Camellia sinensis]XP_028120686.1 uncharacterized protein LOC114318042 isoform X1 [Camellia sinensis]XP_028120687.1 uncharacterized protein LOC114318042 isoform X1 [Camellia sinensis]XP_028120688.1 uncharacterized protein LOC114318042 isoform X1 [Camellia sinensis]XP_028120689.1 uncharacterized protein LOC114318042 isoform X1 [Camellia sinensis]XP_028120691.1 un